MNILGYAHVLPGAMVDLRTSKIIPCFVQFNSEYIKLFLKRFLPIIGANPEKIK